MDQAVYRGGVRYACGDLSDELEKLRTLRDGFIWIGLKDPTDAEFDTVNDELALHPLAVEDAVKGNQRAKIEPYEGSILAVLKTLRYLEETSDVETGEVMVFVGDRFVVTVRRGEGNPLHDVRHRLELNRDQLALGPTAVLHAVMDSVVDNYVLIERALSDDMDRIEQQVFTGAEDTDVTAIYRLKREVLEFRRAAYPLAEALEPRGHPAVSRPYRERGAALLPRRRRPPGPGQRPHRVLRPAAHRHLQRSPHPGHGAAERGHAAVSAWVAMAAVPTLLAGIYGMNFQFMPELTASVDINGHESTGATS